jgi:hypothetical protein
MQEKLLDKHNYDIVHTRLPLKVTNCIPLTSAGPEARRHLLNLDGNSILDFILLFLSHSDDS